MPTSRDAVDHAVATISAYGEVDPQTRARMEQAVGRTLVAHALSVLKRTFTEQTVRQLMVGPMIGLLIGSTLVVFSLISIISLGGGPTRTR